MPDLSPTPVSATVPDTAADTGLQPNDLLPCGHRADYVENDEVTADEHERCAPEVFELDVPLVHGRPPLNANDRMHWRPERQRKILIRDAVEFRAKAARIGTARHITVQLHYLPGDNRRRDASNLMPTQKPAVDALVRAGVVPDDTADWVTELMPVIHPKGDDPVRRLWLTVEVQR